MKVLVKNAGPGPRGHGQPPAPCTLALTFAAMGVAHWLHGAGAVFGEHSASCRRLARAPRVVLFYTCRVKHCTRTSLPPERDGREELDRQGDPSPDGQEKGSWAVCVPGRSLRRCCEPWGAADGLPLGVVALLWVC